MARCGDHSAGMGVWVMKKAYPWNFGGQTVCGLRQIDTAAPDFNSRSLLPIPVRQAQKKRGGPFPDRL